MNDIASFVERYNKDREVFSQFTIDADLQGRAEKLISSLSKEQNLLMKELIAPKCNLADCLVYKIKKKSLFLEELIEKYNFTLAQLIHCKYSCNYAVELQNFPIGTSDIDLTVKDIKKVENKDSIAGEFQLKFSELWAPGMQEICWDFPEAVANYVYVQDQENFFEKTHWLGHPQCNNGKSGLEEAINGALRYGLLGEANELPNYTDELDFTGDAEKRYVRLNEMLKGFIKLDFSDKPFLIYSMDC